MMLSLYSTEVSLTSDNTKVVIWFSDCWISQADRSICQKSVEEQSRLDSTTEFNGLE